MTRRLDAGVGRDSARVGAQIAVIDFMKIETIWTCEKWDQDVVDWARKEFGFASPDDAGSAVMRELGIEPNEIEVVPGNLLLNEGIQRMLDLLIVAGGTGYNNANAFIGVGDTNTAEAATQTELQAAQNAANRFYKGMVATYPQRTNQTVDWRSDFTTSEANFVWAEWTIAAGATTASGGGFLVGTTNINRKVQTLGTKATGLWTLTGSVTIS